MPQSATVTHGDSTILVGKAVKTYGIRGWLKIRSYTRPVTNILLYSPWLLRTQDASERYTLEANKKNGACLYAKLADVNDRECAMALAGSDILVQREQMQDTSEKEYYWHDLIGIRVYNQTKQCLGKLTDIIETTEQDILVVKGTRQYLIPCIYEYYVLEIDLQTNRLTVDWHMDWEA